MRKDIREYSIDNEQAKEALYRLLEVLDLSDTQILRAKVTMLKQSDGEGWLLANCFHAHSI